MIAGTKLPMQKPNTSQKRNRENEQLNKKLINWDKIRLIRFVNTIICVNSKNFLQVLHDCRQFVS